MNSMTRKIALPFFKKGLFVSAKRAFPFLKKAYAFFRYCSFSRIPEWLRPIPVWTMSIAIDKVRVSDNS